jgi:hypothetical protein
VTLRESFTFGLGDSGLKTLRKYVASFEDIVSHDIEPFIP